MGDRKSSVSSSRIEEALAESRPLYITAFPPDPEEKKDCQTLGAVWDRAAQLHEDSLCLGSRDVVQVLEEAQSDEGTCQKLILGDYGSQSVQKPELYVNQVKPTIPAPTSDEKLTAALAEAKAWKKKAHALQQANKKRELAEERERRLYQYNKDIILGCMVGFVCVYGLLITLRCFISFPGFPYEKDFCSNVESLWK